MIGDRARAERPGVDGQLVEVALAEEGGPVARHHRQDRVREAPGARAAVELLEADGPAVDVGRDLGGRRRGGVHHERVVMPGARAWPGEEHVVARIAAPEAYAEGIAELRCIRIDDEPAVVRVEVRSHLHGEVVVVAVGGPLQPELHRQLRAGGEVDVGLGEVVDAVEASREIRILRDRPRARRRRRR